MSSIVNGVIRFIGYRITDFVYNCSPSFEFGGKDDGGLRFNFQKVVTQMNDCSIQLNLRTNVFYSANEDMEKAPFKISLEIAGRFDSEIPWEKQWETNALAILFPYVRVIISTITSQSGREPIILPTVNLASMFKYNNQEESKNSDSEPTT